jgi:hypothetical protein
VLRALAQAAPHLRVLAGGLAASIRMRTRSRRSDKNTFAFVAKAPRSLKRWRGMLSVANRRRPSACVYAAIVWAESQPMWPDGSRPRPIVIDERPGQLKM